MKEAHALVDDVVNELEALSPHKFMVDFMGAQTHAVHLDLVPGCTIELPVQPGPRVMVFMDGQAALSCEVHELRAKLSLLFQTRAVQAERRLASLNAGISAIHAGSVDIRLKDVDTDSVVG